MPSSGPRTGPALASLEAQTKLLAQQRKQRMTTAHVLLALFQRGAAREVFAAAGATEPLLLDAIGRVGAEPDLSVTLVRDRAERLATSFGAAAPHDLHVLCVLAREVRSAAFRMLHAARVSPTALEQAILHALRAENPARGNAVAQPRAVEAQAQRPARQASAAHARTGIARAWGQRRRPVAAAQQQLALETEQRRSRMRKGGDTASEPTGSEAVSERSAARLPASDEISRALRSLVAGAPASRTVARPSEEDGGLSARALDPKAFPLLSSLGKNLSLAAERDEIDPVLGRDAEIELVLDVLSRRRARNPIVVGAPGVGKTSVIEGVARALVHADDPRILIELPVSALLSGTGVRGAVSERITGILREVQSAQAPIVVFIDEAHGVLGEADNADSISGALKTALARGELACIAATTEAEYRRVFERDAALARRFTRVEVQEPSREIALQIVRGIAPEYEAHHRVRFDDAAFEAAIDLSVRFMSERRLPDKAIGVLDQAAARVKRRGGRRVDPAAVAETISEQCAVPLERLLMRDADLLLGLEGHLERRVVGQAHVLGAVSDALRKGAAGFRGNRPLGTLLFLGPTGVGKTELAKAVADRMFPGSTMTRIDMSELSEAHGVARLLGAPPGYLGHEEGGQLTEAVRLRPYQLVLLDEIEKAHRDVLLALLPLLDEGRLTDGRGRTVDFTNTVIAMTSNLGAEALTEKRSVGFESSTASTARSPRGAMLDAARRALPPELWNRIDEPLCFDPLTAPDLERIARLMVGQAAGHALREHGVSVECHESAIEVLVRAGYDPALGARPMRRAVSRLLEAPLARALLTELPMRGERIAVYGRGEALVIERAARPTHPSVEDAAE
jgi:ATP-dependent Clp protease ATP-binding subunit ClpC